MKRWGDRAMGQLAAAQFDAPKAPETTEAAETFSRNLYQNSPGLAALMA